LKSMGKGIVSVLMVCVLFLAGCNAGTTGNPATEPSTTDAGGNEEVVLTFWAAGDWLKGEDSPGQQTIKEFNEKYAGKIKVEGKYAPWSEHNTAIQAAFTSNDLPDLFHMPLGSDINKMVSQKMIQPLDGLVSDQWYGKFYDGSFVEGLNVVGGKTYTYPLSGPQLDSMLYYNKDVMKAAGLNPDQPPRTWDELRSMAKTVTDQGKGDIFGLVYGGGDVGYTLRLVGGLVSSADPTQGVVLTDGGLNLKKGQYTLTDPAWGEAIHLVLSMKEDGSILPSSYSLKHSEAGVLFGQGKAAFMIDGRWRMWQTKRDTPDASFGMSHVPSKVGNTPHVGYQLAPRAASIVVSATTKHPKEVGIFLEEAFAAEPFYKRYLASGVALSPLPVINEDKNNYPYPEFESFAQIHDQVLRISPNPLVRNPRFTGVTEEIGGFNQSKVKPTLDEVLQMIMTGAEKNPGAILEDLNDKLNAGLSEGIKKVKASGVDVSHDDLIFPNWDPAKDYTPQDYKALK